MSLAAVVGAANWAGATLETRNSAAADDLLLPGLQLGLTATNQEPPKIFRPAAAIAKNMSGPDGIALDPETGDLFVAEENGTAIIRLRPDGSRQVVCDANTTVYEEKDGIRRRAMGLLSPEGLALDGKGTLYVAEDVPGGRLIAFDLQGRSGRQVTGRVVSLPLEQNRIAWESVAARPTGELLLAGSTMESALRDPGQGGLFRGAILYRDAKGHWWMPLNHAMASYSAVAFSADGNYAAFACEVPGTIGYLDLRSHYLRTYLSDKAFSSPEGLCALPGGAVLVAEENGKITWLDPTTDRTLLLYEHDGTIESIQWDEAARRLLVTDDLRGELVALELRMGLDFQAAFGTLEDIPFKAESTPIELVPEQCPKYLADVLKLGGYDATQNGEGLAFRDFARRYCLVAVDARTKLLSRPGSVEDPIKQIQFVIVAPYLIGFQEGELIWSSSGFTVVKESGQVIKTELVKRQVIHGDLMESRFTPVGGQNIALPVPFSARINADGHVAVNFMGMGVVSDFYLVLDATEPNNSAMVVVQPDGYVQQYQVVLPPRKDRAHWVVALEHKGPDVWKSLPLKKKPGN